MKIINHRLIQAKRLDSPNFNVRPIKLGDTVPEISLLVLHNISLPEGLYKMNHVSDFFLNTLDEKADPYFKTISHLKVSSHLFIRRDGEIIQYVGFDKRAWHAGESCYQGRKDCNDYSIGIELEGVDDALYDVRQLNVLYQVCLSIMKAYPAITSTRITGHEFIAPFRKTDPGTAFKWDDLFNVLKSELVSA
jgi:AmpD protein